MHTTIDLILIQMIYVYNLKSLLGVVIHSKRSSYERHYAL